MACLCTTSEVPDSQSESLAARLLQQRRAYDKRRLQAVLVQEAIISHHFLIRPPRINKAHHNGQLNRHRIDQGLQKACASCEITKQCRKWLG